MSGLGIPLLVRPADVDEAVRSEAPAEYLSRVVEDKRRAALSRAASEPCAALLVADTIVVLDEEILGKPVDVADALRLLSRLSGRTHTVFTRYAVQAGEEIVTRSVASQVRMRLASEEVLRRYAETGEGLDKAGAYAVQGIGAFLVQAIDGSYSNVVGLPACEVVLDLERLGLLGDFPTAA